MLVSLQRMNVLQSSIIGAAILNPRHCRSLLSLKRYKGLLGISANYCQSSHSGDTRLFLSQKDIAFLYLARNTQWLVPVQSYTTKIESNAPIGKKESKDDFQLVYFIKYLTPIRIVSLMKVYQTIFVAGMFPVFGYMWSQGSITDEVFYGAGSFMVFSTLMLFVIAQYFTSVICAIYIDENREKVKISHLTFRTRRKDVILNIQDICPIFDVNANKKDLYYDIKTYDKKYRLKLFLDYGTVHDQKLLAELLGKML